MAGRGRVRPCTSRPTSTASVGLSISAWTVQHVNLFPCRWTTPAFSDELFERTAEGQAQALSAWWGQDPNAPFSSNATIAPIATKPRATTIGGYPAWYVEVLVPSVFDFSQCDGGQLVLWRTADGDVRYALGPGELDRLWVVDIHGTPIVIDAGSCRDGVVGGRRRAPAGRRLDRHQALTGR